MKGLLAILGLLFGAGLIIYVVAGVGGGADLTAGPISNRVEEAHYPEPTAYVMDDSGVLSNETFNLLEGMLEEFDRTNHTQVAVVTVDTTSPLYLEQYSIKLAEKLKVGYAGIDNGVILLVVTKDRKIRIEVGRGVEDKLTDAEAGRIINNRIAPLLKNGNWGGGISLGVQDILDELR